MVSHRDDLRAGHRTMQPMSRRSPLSAIVTMAFLAALAPASLRADPQDDEPAPDESKPATQQSAEPKAAEPERTQPNDAQRKDKESKPAGSERRSDSPRRRHDGRARSHDGGSSIDVEGIAYAAVTGLGIVAGIFNSVAEAYMQGREEALARHTPTDAWREIDGTGRSHWRLPLVGAPPDRYYQPDP